MTARGTNRTWDAASMLDVMPELVNRYRFDDRVITYCNAAWAAQYGTDQRSAIGRCLDEFLSPDEMDGLRSQLALLGPDNPVLTDGTARAVPGDPGRWLEWVDRYLPSDDGPEVLSVGRDVTDRHLAELRLIESEARYRDLADSCSDIVWRIAAMPTPHFEYLSPSVETILGYPPSYFLDEFARIIEIIDQDGLAIMGRALRGEGVPLRFDVRLRHADGSLVVGETSTTTLDRGVQGLTRDVTELRRLQESTEALALRDPLTGLANRRLFNDLLAAELARTESAGVPLAVAYIDLDGLKQVNDQYGHDAGDLVLQEAARRLLFAVDEPGLLARLGGDEFALVYEPIRPSSDGLVQRLDELIAGPIRISDTTSVRCGASIGVADTRDVGRRPAELLAAADRAMYVVKRMRASGAAPLGVTPTDGGHRTTAPGSSVSGATHSGAATGS